MRKLIIVEGMSGSGKSTLAQYLHLQLSQKMKSINWFHEEESNHPIYNDSYCEYLSGDNPSKFKDTVLGNWKDFINYDDDSVEILEAQIILNIIANYKWSNFPDELLDDFLHSLVKLINKNPCNDYIYLFSNNPVKLVENSIKGRGEKWGGWYLDYFNKSSFALGNNKQDLIGIGYFWQSVYKIADKFYELITCKKLKIEITDQNWNEYYSEIDTFFNYGFREKLSIDINIEKYVGEYILDKEIINVYIREEKLFCDFKWKGLELIPKPEDGEFCIKSFPHQFRFQTRDNLIDSIKIIGKDIAGLKGREYRRIIK